MKDDNGRLLGRGSRAHPRRKNVMPFMQRKEGFVWKRIANKEITLEELIADECPGLIFGVSPIKSEGKTHLQERRRSEGSKTSTFIPPNPETSA